MKDRETNPDIRKLIRNFILELIVYGALVTVYFFAVLNFLSEFINNLFFSNLVLYAVLALVLIVVQGVFLDLVTSFQLNQIKLERLE